MDAFNYLSVLLSLILGLGITHVLTSAGRLVHARSRVRPYWPTVLWGAMLLLVYVQSWWATFGLRTHAQWSFLMFLVVLLHAITLYLAAALLLPEGAGEGAVDLRAVYFAQAPWFFGALAFGVLASLAKDVVIDGRLPEARNVAFHVFFLALTLPAAIVRRESYHKAIALGAPVGFCLYVAVLFSRLR